MQGSKEGWQAKKEDKKGEKKKVECFYCHGEHYMRDCPKLKKKAEKANSAVEQKEEGEVSLVGFELVNDKVAMSMLTDNNQDFSLQIMENLTI